MYCKDCKFFGEEQEYFSDVNDYNEPIKSGYHKCDAIDHLDDIGARESVEKGEGPKAFAKDGSGYYAALKVRGDFGCVLFKAT
jgi:hypothetical protein